MLVLALDTSSSAVTAGLLRLSAAGAPEVLAERVTINARAHGELLMPSVCGVLARARVSMHDLDAVVCGAGPGPFTGLRVGMVTAAALGDALNVPVYPVVSLDAIAYRAAESLPGGDGVLLVITDARRHEVYWARYDCDVRKGDVRKGGVRLDGPHVGRPADLPLAGVSRVAGAADALSLPAELPVVPPQHPDPAALVAVVAAELRSHTPPDPLTPLYLRRPDAVEPGLRKRVTPV